MAARFGVVVSPGIRWEQRFRERGNLMPDKRGGNHRAHRVDSHRYVVLAVVEAEPDLMLAEIAERLETATGYRPQPSIVYRLAARHGIAREEGPALPRSRTGKT